MIELEIDDQKITVEPGASIIEAADQVGIYIPRFCYHKKLSIAANCRMCLVEVANSGKPLPACATPVTSEMKVYTTSPKALQAQRDVMEFLLINHPLDCPIRDQGGECELQDLAMGYGRAYSNYKFGKRSVYDEDLGPLIETEMTRCIQCTRCVRFGDEIAGMRELGVVNRGEDEKISTYIKHFLKSELSGNIIDICPVGALTAKPSRYEVRGWEVREHPSVSPHDCVGSNTYIHSRGQEFFPQRIVMRVVSRENEAINETWISDRDRFSYAGLYHHERVYKPRMKIGFKWEEMTWDNILTQLSQRLQKIISHEGPEQLAALASPNSTIEEFYLLQKLTRALGSNNIDHRLHQFDFSDQQNVGHYPGLNNLAITDIEKLSTILLVGSDVRNEQPLICHHMNQATQNNTKISAINLQHYSLPFKLNTEIVHYDLIQPLAEIVKVLTEQVEEPHSPLANIMPSEVAKTIANQLKSSENAAIFMGAQAINHPKASQIRALLTKIQQLTGASLNWLTEGANSTGAWLAGAIPHRGVAGHVLESAGLPAHTLLTTQPVKIYFLLNLEPEFDAAYPAAAFEVLKNADLVVCLTTFITPLMEQYADVILPIAPFTETAGTYVNVAGTWQSFTPVSIPQGESRPAWQVLVVLASMLGIDNFDYDKIDQVRHDLKLQIEQMTEGQTKATEVVIKPLSLPDENLIRLAPWPIYRTDNLVRRSKPLQETMSDEFFSISINQKMAQQLSLKAGDEVTATQGSTNVTLPLQIDNRLADYTVLIYSGLTQTAGFGQAWAPVFLEKEKQ